MSPSYPASAISSARLKELGVDLPADAPETQALLEHGQALESRGFQYDNAEASFDLLVHRARPGYKAPFELVDFMVVVESRRPPRRAETTEEMLSEAMVKVRVDGEMMHTAAEGNGPVNALDTALRKGAAAVLSETGAGQAGRLQSAHPGRKHRHGIAGAGADRVHRRREEWHTVGSSTNIIEASWLALADSLEWWLLKNRGKGK